MSDGRLDAFTDVELDALVAAMYSAEGEGAFDGDSDLWREFVAEAKRRDLCIEVYGRRIL